MNPFNCFRNRPPYRYAEPLNRAWTPETGEEIERRYAPEIQSWEIANNRFQQDYTLEQRDRFSAWRKVVFSGIDWQGLIFCRTLVAAGRLGSGDTSAESGGAHG